MASKGKMATTLGNLEHSTTSTFMPANGHPALTELAEHLKHRGIDTDPREFAAIILEIVRDKMPSKDAHGLVDWVQQLAMDMSDSRHVLERT